MQALEQPLNPPPEERPPVLQAIAVSKHFYSKGWGRRKRVHRAVHGVDLALRLGETTALVGESGSGKTTLARTLLGIYPPTEGTVLLDGRPLPQVPRAERTRRMQMIFQDAGSAFDPRWSVGSSIAEPLRAHGFARPADRVGELLAQVGLDPSAARRFPHEFSGGQRQRMGIARAIAVEPEILIADEPTSALDVSIRVQILNLLDEIQRRLRMAVLLVSHDLAVVKHYSESIAIMFRGKIVEQGPTARVLARPLHPYTRQLLDAVPRFDAAPAEATLATARTAIESSAEVGCPYRVRCPYQQEDCVNIEPALVDREGQRVACHHPLDEQK